MMMNNLFGTGFGAGNLLFWFHVHITFVVAAFVGAILLAIWAVKNLKKEKLFKLSIWLIAIGVIGYLLTASASVVMHGGYGKYKSFGYGSGMMMDGFGQGMFDCMQDEECHDEIENVMQQMMGIGQDN